MRASFRGAVARSVVDNNDRFNVPPGTFHHLGDVGGFIECGNQCAYSHISVLQRCTFAGADQHELEAAFLQLVDHAGQGLQHDVCALRPPIMHQDDVSAGYFAQNMTGQQP